MLAKLINRCAQRLIQQQIRFSAFSTRSQRKSFDMDKVYLRNAQDTQELHITFRYANEALKVDRDFNFCRRMDECIDEALIRIRNNIEKEVNKRSKKKSKKSEEAVPTAPQTQEEIVVALHRKDCVESIAGITFNELLSDISQGLELRVIDQSLDIVFNQPWVAGLQLPSSIMAGFLVYPLKLQLQFATRQHSKAQWYKTLKPNSTKAEWTPCSEGLIYQLTEEDIDYYLKLVVTPGNEHGVYGPPVEYVTTSPVQAGPQNCPYELRQQYTKKPLSNPAEIRVVSYNLLADLYADGDYARKTLFPYCAPANLKIDYRKQLFIKELIGYNADLLCLQEVDIKIFDYDLQPVLAEDFQGIMTPKGKVAEGIALFYRTSRFELLNTYVLHLGDNISSLPIFAPLWQKIKHNEQLATRICDRSTTLQLCLFQLKGTKRYVMVANTHLYFHPDADHIRLLQIGFSLIFVEHIYKQAIKEHGISDPQNIGLIFCGDFNSVPECGIYKLMTEQFVDSNFVDWSSNQEEAVKDVELRQSFKMVSACGTPEFTNYTTLFAACLDYIFYQSDSFDLLQSVPLPSVEELSANEAIPSVTFPSDHVSLVADLKFKSSN
ncbi:2',5'-phosphodiesterase 12 [Drosophila albomicans]|uniref:2',5'-phosphodiesterase 12 n=1 Tax=Drosophila albomicans TaxID=7291 RepID=A0A6P8X556_DROAB|nr:2',5'-phosphodiesterase 12 [Drosophila albomicans]